MKDKKLSEKCVEYCKITEGLSEIEDRLNNKILEIIELYDNFTNSIEHYSLLADNKTLEVVYEYSSCDDYGHDTFIMPIEWLDLDNAGVKRVVEIRIEDEIKLRRELMAKAEEKRKKEAEMKERAEYERLKAKFEKGEQ